jgi:predicted nucleotide-binding protein
MTKYNGTIDDLKKALNDNAITGNWSENNLSNIFRANGGAVLQFYKNGTLQIQGKSGASKTQIEKLVSELGDQNNAPELAVATAVAVEVPKQQLFLVYGHDETSRDQLELVLAKMGIEGFILAKSSGHGLTIIEALEKQVGQNGAATAGIVLLTPDDKGYSVKDGETKTRDRARQNVILEMGMLISKLGRSHTIILIKGDLEKPSDVDGMIYMSYKNHVKEVVAKIAERLEYCGFDIDHKKVIKAGQ